MNLIEKEMTSLPEKSVPRAVRGHRRPDWLVWVRHRLSARKTKR